MRGWFYKVLITARKRSLGQGNVFTCVCHSFHRGKGGLHSGGLPLGRGSASRGLSRPPLELWKAGSYASYWNAFLFAMVPSFIPDSKIYRYCREKLLSTELTELMSYKHVRVNQKHDGQWNVRSPTNRISCQFLTSIQIIWFTESVPFTVSLRFFLLRWQKIY